MNRYLRIFFIEIKKNINLEILKILKKGVLCFNKNYSKKKQFFNELLAILSQL